MPEFLADACLFVFSGIHLEVKGDAREIKSSGFLSSVATKKEKFKRYLHFVDRNRVHKGGVETAENGPPKKFESGTLWWPTVYTFENGGPPKSFRRWTHREVREVEENQQSISVLTSCNTHFSNGGIDNF